MIILVGDFNNQIVDFSFNIFFGNIDKIWFMFSLINVNGVFLFWEIIIVDFVDCNFIDVEDLVVICLFFLVVVIVMVNLV